MELGESVEAPVTLREAHRVALKLLIPERVTVALPQEVRVPLKDAVKERIEECEAGTVKESSVDVVMRELALTLSELVRVLLSVTLSEGDRVEKGERLPEAVTQPDAVLLCAGVCEAQGLLVWLALTL